MIQHQDYSIPLKENLTQLMEISVVVKENGDFWLLHDQHFLETPDYLEYDPDRKALTLVTEMGNVHSVDIDLPPRAYERLKNASTGFVIYMADREKMEQIVPLPVIVQHHV